MTSRGKKSPGRRGETLEHRLRVVFGVSDGGRIPRVTLSSFRKYRAYLTAHVVFPFGGRLHSPVGPHRDTESPLTVLRLLDPVEEYTPEGSGGLICKAEQNGKRIELPLERIEADEDSPSRQFVADYSVWAANWA